MADLPELSDHIYEQYRTYLFKYNKALETLKAQEKIKSENKKLKNENLTLKVQLREIKIEKTAAETKIKMMKEEFEEMMKKNKLDSENTINRTSNWVNSEIAKTRKKKI